MADLRIRPARASDEADWLAMFQDLTTTAPEPCAEEAPPEVWRWAMDPAHAMSCLIAEDAGQPAGFVLSIAHPYSWTLKPICYLLDLYVRPESRGKGLGRALIEALAERGRAEGWLKIYWMTQADNELSQALYDKLATRSPLVRYDLYLDTH